MTTLITFILVLGFLIFIHELGHFFAARLIGVKVQEFSIGFPPKMISKTFRGTEYMISWIPIGGYVRLWGQNYEDEAFEEPGNYASKSIGQRLLILLAGPMMNLLAALILVPIVLFIGYEVPAYLEKPPVIDGIRPGSPAETLNLKKGDRIVAVNGQHVTTWREVQKWLYQNPAEETRLEIERNHQVLPIAFATEETKHPGGMGWDKKIEAVVGFIASGSPAAMADLHSGDRIVEINGIPIAAWADVSRAVQLSGGQSLEIRLKRNGKYSIVSLTPEMDQDTNRWLIGISSAQIRVSESLPDAIILGTKRVWTITAETYHFLARMLRGQEKSEAVGGPIMIAQMIGQAAKSSVSDLIYLTAIISLQLCIFNLLPIPALDGGHIFFLLLEKIKGSALSRNIRLFTQKVGFLLLIGLIVFISVQDSLRLFR